MCFYQIMTVISVGVGVPITIVIQTNLVILSLTALYIDTPVTEGSLF